METKLKLINEALKAWHDAGRPENETMALLEWLLKKHLEAEIKVMDLRDALLPFSQAKNILDLTVSDLKNAADAHKIT